jgi:hypothetical protein
VLRACVAARHTTTPDAIATPTLTHTTTHLARAPPAPPPPQRTNLFPFSDRHQATRRDGGHDGREPREKKRLHQSYQPTRRHPFACYRLRVTTCSPRPLRGGVLTELQAWMEFGGGLQAGWILELI